MTLDEIREEVKAGRTDAWLVGELLELAENLLADNDRLAQQVGKLIAELERAQAGEKTR